MPGPRSIGFDYFFGLSANPRNGPHSFIENEELMGKLPGRPVSISGFGANAKTSGIVAPFKTDEIMQNITKRVTTWIAENHADPFFVYFAPNAVHTPIAPNRAFTGSPYGKYGDFIHEVDASVGQILATLDALDLAKDTLVIFTSDNGGDINRGSPVHVQAMDSGLKPNGDLRGGKLHVWEGGFRVPFIVRWPGQVPEDSVSEQILSLTDLLATFAQITDVPLPDGAAEDSFDMLAAFTESSQGPPCEIASCYEPVMPPSRFARRTGSLLNVLIPQTFEPRSQSERSGSQTCERTRRSKISCFSWPRTHRRRMTCVSYFPNARHGCANGWLSTEARPRRDRDFIGVEMKIASFPPLRCPWYFCDLSKFGGKRCAPWLVGSSSFYCSRAGLPLRRPISLSKVCVMHSNLVTQKTFLTASTFRFCA